MKRFVQYLCLALWVWLAVAFQLSAAGTEASGNRVSIKQSGDGRYQVSFRVEAFELSATGEGMSVTCHFDDGRLLESMYMPGIPRYTKVIEIEQGGWADAQVLSIKEERVPFDPQSGQGIPVQLSESPIHAEIGRMGKRIFLRLSFYPFHVTDEQMLAVRKEVTANIYVSSEPPGRIAESASLLESNRTVCAACPVALPVGIPDDTGDASDFSARRSVTNDLAWKIIVNKPGLYRISEGDLYNAGITYQYRDTTRLKVSVRGQALPIWTSTTGPMATNDWIMFYGAGVDSSVTTQNVYWLTVEDVSPAVPVQDGTPIMSVPVVTSGWSHVDYSPRNLFRSQYEPESDYENWFAMSVTATTSSNILFATPSPVTTGVVQLAYTLHGRGNLTSEKIPDHCDEIYVGGVLVTGFCYNAQTRTSTNMSIPASLLSNPTTTVSVREVVDVPNFISSNIFKSGAGVYVESIDMCYEKKLNVSSWPYYFNGSTNEVNIKLLGLSTTNFWLLDVTDPCSPKEVFNYALQWGGSSWNLEFGNASGQSRCYALYRPADLQLVASTTMTRFRDLADTERQADYLAVAPDTFEADVYRLLKHRFKNELRVQVASPEDIYNEFSYGVKDPGAIRQYFGYAYHHYQAPSPEYAVLIGNGSLDPQNRLGNNDTDLIPTKMGWSVRARTSIEQWFVTIDGNDMLPDIKLGRIPASTTTNLAFVVNKLIDYETAPTNAAWMDYVLLVADKLGSTNGPFFKAFTEENTFAHLTNGGISELNIAKAYLDDIPAANVRSTINSELGLGVQFVNYMGHGSEGQWASDDVWKIADAQSRNNTAYPIFSVFTCQNGAFQNAGLTLAEAVLLNEHAGSACVAPTAFAIDFNSELLADGYFAALATNGVERLGEAMEEAFLRLWSYNSAARELLFYTIFGDPAQQVRGGANP